MIVTTLINHNDVIQIVQAALKERLSFASTLEVLTVDVDPIHQKEGLTYLVVRMDIS